MKIDAYEYTDDSSIKHLFFYFAEDRRKAIPYFMLDSEVCEKILLYIMKENFSTNNPIYEQSLNFHP